MTTNLTIPYYAQQRLANLTQIDLEVYVKCDEFVGDSKRSEETLTTTRLRR